MTTAASVATASRPDASATARQTLVWIGPSEGWQWQPAFEYCLRNAPQIAPRQDLADLWKRPAEGVRRIVLVRGNRAADRDEARRLGAAYPQAELWTLVGPQCEGERRSGHPWSGFERLVWHRWNQVMPGWFSGEQSARSRTWQQTSPRSARVSRSPHVPGFSQGPDGALHSDAEDSQDTTFQSHKQLRIDGGHAHANPSHTPPSNGSAICGAILVFARDPQLADAISRAMTSAGRSVATSRHLAPPALTQPYAVIWDDTVAPGGSVAEWQHRIAAATPNARQIIHLWCSSFPRPHDIQAAHQGGVTQVLSKPLQPDALLHWLKT